jgi:hypothetical protein
MFTGCTADAFYAWLPVYMAQAEKMWWGNTKFVEVDIVELTLKTINAEWFVLIITKAHTS